MAFVFSKMAQMGVFISLLVCVASVCGSADIMKQISKGYGAAMAECQKELNFKDDVVKEMMNFWNHEYDLVTRELGCAIICMSKKHNLVGEDGKLHHENAAEFAKKHGADEDMAKKLVEVVHGCEKSSEGPDDCMRVLDMAKCFRSKIKELSWSPNFMELVEEMMAEAQG